MNLAQCSRVIEGAVSKLSMYTILNLTFQPYMTQNYGIRYANEGNQPKKAICACSNGENEIGASPIVYV